MHLRNESHEERPADDMTSFDVKIVSSEREHGSEKKQTTHEHSPVHVLGMDIGRLSRRDQLILCSVGIFSIYQLIAYLQESFFTMKDFPAWYLTMWSFIVGLVLSSTERLKDKDMKMRAPFYWYAIIGFLSVAGVGFSLDGLNHVNYPTAVVFKSSKVIPVMAAGVFVMKKKYGLLEYVSASSFVGGLCMFALADVQVSPKFSLWGILLLSIALLMDAFVGNCQEKVIRVYGVPSAEIVQYTYLVASVLSALYITGTGEMWRGIKLSTDDPEVFFWMLVYGAVSYVGFFFVLALVNRFGAVTCVVVTSTRKLLTIVLSFIMFPKPFNIWYVWGTLALAFGSAISIYMKQPKETLLFIRSLTRALLQAFRKRGTPSSEDKASTPLLPDDKV